MPKKTKNEDDDLNLPEWDESELVRRLLESNDESELVRRLLESNDESELIRRLLESNTEPNLDGLASEPDLSFLIEKNDQNQESVSEPDPSLTEKDVAQWMFDQVQDNQILRQEDAALHIRKNFGDRFVYTNENSNPAISKDVLAVFKRISLKTVVWAKNRFYWRLRKPTDDPNSREVFD